MQYLIARLGEASTHVALSVGCIIAATEAENGFRWGLLGMAALFAIIGVLKRENGGR